MAIIKTSVNLPTESIQALQELASLTGSSMTEVLARAISTEKFLNDIVRDGGTILVQDKNKRVRELVLPTTGQSQTRAT